ncbi:hypothetical protein NNJEOMEG_01671 [Fundidesulfovibrio magnetotacticus]|uniref:Uncharacterized protein n=1 Tax=Fundidesulfovibrio magnetotacticus TaxID=2730080 RepID=A0A6V8M035_9BACT|nr:hypothetical protein [Fundidesulfovibrio magnetotacticus]GFK93835.1 hypothetical protein NNJEOMEG_01671 [Fundidesulfovibrio magnetotacticus]
MSFQFLGHYLVEQGHATRRQVEEACAHQSEANRRLGDFAVEAGMLTHAQVEDILARQRGTGRSFGSLAVSLGYVARCHMDELLFRQSVNQVHLGEALLALGHLDPARFSEILEGYMTRERQRAQRLEAFYGATSRGRALQALARALELAFLRFARCPLKAHGEAGPRELEDLPHRLPCSVTLPGGAELRFTLHLDERMRAMLEQARPDHEDGADLLEAVASYLRENWRDDPAASPAAPPARGVLLASPEARVAATLDAPAA